METGIITRTGKFVPCEEWKHLSTAFAEDTHRQFLLYKSEVLFNGEKHTIDIVGSLNAKMINALFEYATKHDVIVEDIITVDLEDELQSLKRMV